MNFEKIVKSCFPILKILISMKRFFRRRLMVNKWSVTGQLMVDHWSDYKERVLVVRSCCRILVGSNKISRWFFLSVWQMGRRDSLLERNDVKRRVSARMMDFMGSIELRLIATTSFYKIEFFVDIIFQRMYRIHSKKKRKQTKKNIHISFHKRQQYIKKNPPIMILFTRIT